MTANSPFNSWRSASSPELATTTSATSSSTVEMASRLRSSSSTSSTRAGGSAAGGGGIASVSAVACGTGGRVGRIVTLVLLGHDHVDRLRRFARAGNPYPQQREHEIDVDRLGDIVRSAGIQALLAVALHRLRSHGDQRQIGQG